MTLVEFLEPVSKGSNIDRVLITLYYREQIDGQTVSTVDDIRSYLDTARVKGAKHMNISQALNDNGARVHGEVSQGRKKLWRLTKSGREYVRETLGISAGEIEAEHEAGVLEDLIGRIHDNAVRSYLEEALKCLQVEALRACVVFVWSGTIRTIQERMLDRAGPKKVTEAVQHHHNKAKQIRSVDDFAYTTDRTVLLAATDLGLFDKGQKGKLIDALGLRNDCGHPSKYRPGIKKVSAFMEDVTSMVFPS